MAGEEIPEARKATAAQTENTFEAIFEKVVICEACGKGFLTWTPGGMDIWPLWQMWNGESEGYICGGPLSMISRSKAILGATRWLEEQQKK